MRRANDDAARRPDEAAVERPKISSPKSVLLGPRADAADRRGSDDGEDFLGALTLRNVSYEAPRVATSAALLGGSLPDDEAIAASARLILTERYGGLMRLSTIHI